MLWQTGRAMEGRVLRLTACEAPPKVVSAACSLTCTFSLDIHLPELQNVQHPASCRGITVKECPKQCKLLKIMIPALQWMTAGCTLAVAIGTICHTVCALEVHSPQQAQNCVSPCLAYPYAFVVHWQLQCDPASMSCGPSPLHQCGLGRFHQ